MERGVFRRAFLADALMFGYVPTHILGKQILQTYLERCLFRFLQAFSSAISRSHILHRRPFEGLRPDFLTRINLQGMLSQLNNDDISQNLGLTRRASTTGFPLLSHRLHWYVPGDITFLDVFDNIEEPAIRNINKD